MKSTCRQCQGSRVIIKNPCLECHGKGSTVQHKKVTVPVPAGKLFNLKWSLMILLVELKNIDIFITLLFVVWLMFYL